MKKYKSLIGISIGILLFISCSTTENVVSGNLIQKRKYNKGFYINKKSNNYQFSRISNSNKINSRKILNNEEKTSFLEPKEDLVYNEALLLASSSNESFITPDYILSTDDTIKKTKNDLIILTNGDEINAKVEEITFNDIKYRKSENLNGPLYSIKKSEVFMIRYPNGTKDLITTEKQKKVNDKVDDSDFNPYDAIVKNNSKNNREATGIGVWGLLLSILGFATGIFVSMPVGIVLSILGIIFGIVNIVKVSKNAEIYKGRGLGIWSIVISGTTILLTLFVLSL